MQPKVVSSGTRNVCLRISDCIESKNMASRVGKEIVCEINYNKEISGRKSFGGPHFWKGGVYFYLCSPFEKRNRKGIKSQWKLKLIIICHWPSAEGRGSLLLAKLTENCVNGILFLELHSPEKLQLYDHFRVLVRI